MGLRPMAEKFGLSKSEVYKMWDVAEKCDKDGNGLTKEEFKNALKELSLSVNDEMLDKLFDGFDEDKSGRVITRELVTGITVLLNDTDVEMLKIAFDIYDKDKSGFIDREEAKAVLTTYNKSAQHMTGEAYDDGDVETTLAELFKEADLNDDGKIDFQEYCRIVKAHTKIPLDPEFEKMKDSIK